MPTINWELFIDGNRQLGVATIEFPNIESQTVAMKGPGVIGEPDVPILGSDKMSNCKITFNEVTSDVTRLSAKEYQPIEAYVANQNYDRTSGQYKVIQERIEMDVFPLNDTIGNATANELRGRELEFNVRRLKWTVDGEVKREFDPLNYINSINGKDWYQDVRTALGL